MTTGHDIINPNPLMIVPFVVLLGAIAFCPLVIPRFWHKHYGKVALSLGAISVAYYIFFLGAHERVWYTVHEYVSFICLIGSLFVVSGGIHISVKGEATPWENVRLLFVGAIIANLLGTTGASMLLIRPWIRMNRYRIKPYHIVFFIFIVSNCGGCLTPIGDPPLFLGYLKGIPFFWVLLHCWPMWLIGVGALVGIFYVIDTIHYRKIPATIRAQKAEPPNVWKFEGLWNLLFLGVIIGAVFITNPPFLREAIMITAATLSYVTTGRHIHHANHFNFHPIQEVAILFAGIFATMMPALDWLQLNASQLGITSTTKLFWACGFLSTVLDNAPTYLSFLSAVMGSTVDQQIVHQVLSLAQSNNLHSIDLSTYPESVRNTVSAIQFYFGGKLQSGYLAVEQIEIAYLLGNPHSNIFIVAISIAAVFFGASTYIGNGPNFMVKSIAEQQNIQMPTFMGYIIKYTVPYLLPIFFVIWILFFRD